MKRVVLCVCLLAVLGMGLGLPSAFAQAPDSSQKNGENTVIGVIQEGVGLVVQYIRTINALKTYWEEENELGLKEGRYVNSTGNPRYARVKTIFDKLLESPYLTQERAKYNWRIYLQNTDSVNAFAAVDGIIIVNKGIVEFCKDDNELAIVIGHEIAHMVKGHINRQIAFSIIKDPLIEHISAYLAQIVHKRASTEEASDAEVSDKQLFQFIFGLAGNLSLLKFSRSQEETADEEGARYAASVGYNVDAGYDFWMRMSSSSSSTDSKWLAFLNTHPYSEGRAKAFLDRR